MCRESREVLVINNERVRIRATRLTVRLGNLREWCGWSPPGPGPCFKVYDKRVDLLSALRFEIQKVQGTQQKNRQRNFSKREERE